VVYRSFELDPERPEDERETVTGMLARKYGMPEAQARAVGAGLDPAAVKEVPDGGAHADAVRRDELEARQPGIGGVPFLAIGMALGVPGAQATETFASALDQAWARRG
jgi:predicted DsbA family dithiol-disulfide isomerase